MRLRQADQWAFIQTEAEFLAFLSFLGTTIYLG